MNKRKKSDLIKAKEYTTPHFGIILDKDDYYLIFWPKINAYLHNTIDWIEKYYEVVK